MMSRFLPFNRRDRDSISSNLMAPFNMIDDFIGETVGNFPSNISNLGKVMLADTFKVDVSETANHYLIEAELPDVKREEIDVYLNEGNLTIYVERKEETEEKSDDKSYIHKERRFSSMERSLYLVDAVTETSKVTAKLENGLLEMTVPKEKRHDKLNDEQKIKIE